ncbi:MAG TPA: hypothetical protein VI541_03635 [Actinomycetota bacterium]|nr:hypothetical protein [Actinomycetota bacterium]
MRYRRAASLLASVLIGLVAFNSAFAAGSYPQYTTRPVPTSGQDAFAVAVNGTTGYAFAAMPGSNTLSIIATDIKAEMQSLPMPDGPAGVAVNEVTNKIYVSSYGNTGPTGHMLSIIDGNTFTRSEVDLGYNMGGYGVAVNATTNKIYVASFGSNSLAIIDGATLATSTVEFPTFTSIVPDIPVNEVPVCTSQPYAPTDTAYYCVNDVEPQPIGVAVNESTNKVYVTGWGSNQIFVIDGASNALESTISDDTSPGGLQRISGPWGIAVNQAAQEVHVAMPGNSRLSTIDTNPTHVSTYNKFIRCLGETGGTRPCTLGAQNGITTLAFDAPRNQLVAAFYNQPGSVKVYNPATNWSSTSITAGVTTIGVGVNPSNGDIYSANPGNLDNWFKKLWLNPSQGVRDHAGDPVGFLMDANSGSKWQSINPGFVSVSRNGPGL